ncbi:hypothetical protein [Bradyrhizobium sp. CB3481]|uniref:hypothetical protein n=1 Tax=Bradyrhizobium sp. CB3481 TaxID=3039158 RepID=UPI0024B1E738|nr:hypothetical protein [Bradyrhizobium sp. CB3481]WFU14132.1 hypothetical protein QA643_23235 [Bradyrhizobium sp. CB3481]
MPDIYNIGSLEPFVHALPAEEQPAAMVLIFNLIQLNRLVNDFGAAVALLEHAESHLASIQILQTQNSLTFVKESHVLELWKEMAGRDSTSTIFHFGKTLEAFGKSMNRSPTIANGALHEKLRAAKRSFRTAFPAFELLRHGVSHRAESTISLESLKKHSENGAFIFGKMTNRSFTISFEGAHRTLTIDKPTRRVLAKITNETYAAFPRLTPNLPVAYEG